MPVKEYMKAHSVGLSPASLEKHSELPDTGPVCVPCWQAREAELFIVSQAVAQRMFAAQPP